jgi:hypothetical protein
METRALVAHAGQTIQKRKNSAEDSRDARNAAELGEGDDSTGAGLDGLNLDLELGSELRVASFP